MKKHIPVNDYPVIVIHKRKAKINRILSAFASWRYLNNKPLIDQEFLDEINHCLIIKKINHE